MLKPHPFKNILASSTWDNLHDKPTPTKWRKIGPTLSCAQLEVNSRMVKFGGLKTISVKPIPLILEQPLIYNHSSNLGASKSITIGPVSSIINSCVRFSINLVENYRAFVLDITLDEQPLVKWMIEPASSNCPQ